MWGLSIRGKRGGMGVRGGIWWSLVVLLAGDKVFKEENLEIKNKKNGKKKWKLKMDPPPSFLLVLSIF